MYKFLMPESSSIMFLSPVNFYSFIKYYLRLKITFQLFLVNNNKRHMGKKMVIGQTAHTCVKVIHHGFMTVCSSLVAPFNAIPK